MKTLIGDPFYASRVAAALFVVTVWVMVSYTSLVRGKDDERRLLGVALLLLYTGGPIAFWLAGTHRVLGDFQPIPMVTAGQRIIGRSAVVAAVAIFGIAAMYFTSRTERFELRGRRLWLGYIAFAAGPVLAMMAGTQPGFRYSALFTPAATTVLYFCMAGNAENWVRLARRLLMVYVWGSVAVTILEPVWAYTQETRATLLFGPRHRLIGVTTAPNTLGPVAAAAFLLVIGSSRGRWRLVNGIVAGGVLVFSDSRMALLGAALGTAIIFVSRKEDGPNLRPVIVVAVVAVPLGILASSTAPMERLASATHGSLSPKQVSTVGGRAGVWAVTLDEWHHNPVFGYGPGLWSPEYRAQFGSVFNWVGQAHNQWIQTLGESGLIGLMGLGAYMVALIRLAIVGNKRSHGLAGALVALLFFRMLSEAALHCPSIDANTLQHLVTFTVLLAYAHDGRRQPIKMTDTATSAT